MNQGNAIGCENKIKQAGRIKNTIDDLINMIDQTQFLVEELERYTAPILKYSSPAEDKLGVPSDPNASQVTVILENLGIKVASTNRALQNILERIEL